MKKLLALAPALFAASMASATVPVYGSIGTPNNGVDESYGYYEAQESGTVYAWFLGKEASYRSVISLFVNGVKTAESPIFPNYLTAPGAQGILGTVKKGDILTLELTILHPWDVAGTVLSSVRANNADGNNHIYTERYYGGDFGIPTGDYLYVGFEDINGARDPNFRNDWDYDDHRFVFDIKGLPAVPEPATWLMMISGFGLVGLSARRRRRTHVAA